LSQRHFIYLRAVSRRKRIPTVLHQPWSVVLLAFAIGISGCEKNDSSVIDPPRVPPTIVSASISPATVNLDTVTQSQTSFRFVVTAFVCPAAAASSDEQVNYSLSDVRGQEVIAGGSLYDRGVSPDEQAGDSLYTGAVEVPTDNLPVGTYFCRVAAQGTAGATSNSFLLPVTIGRQLNHPPSLSDVQAPDTIVLGTVSQQFKLTVTATDPDGLTDVAKVFFHSYKPDGTITNHGNAFLMYDDGSENIIVPPDIVSGDIVKGDGIYTLTVSISPTDSEGKPTDRGAYRFEFQATDRSNANSNTLTHFVYVK
jgi:hypothetical protein